MLMQLWWLPGIDKIILGFWMEVWTVASRGYWAFACGWAYSGFLLFWAYTTNILLLAESAQLLLHNGLYSSCVVKLA